MLAMAACAGPEGVLVPEAAAPAPDRASREFFLEPVRNAWAAEAEALVLAQRRLPRAREQLIGLTNDTTLRGDNFILLVAYGSPAHVPRSFTLESVLERVGGVPFPFETLSDAELKRRRDGLGTTLWKEFDTRTGVNCVLALRRLEFDTRILPANTAAMEVVLRNCVTGSTEEALEPVGPDRLAVGIMSASVNGGVRPRVLNPLAAPEP